MFPIEIEHHIITRFLDGANALQYRMVHRQAYNLLSENELKSKVCEALDESSVVQSLAVCHERYPQFLPHYIKISKKKDCNQTVPNHILKQWDIGKLALVYARWKIVEENLSDLIFALLEKSEYHKLQIVRISKPTLAYFLSNVEIRTKLLERIYRNCTVDQVAYFWIAFIGESPDNIDIFRSWAFDRYDISAFIAAYHGQTVEDVEHSLPEFEKICGIKMDDKLEHFKSIYVRMMPDQPLSGIVSARNYAQLAVYGKLASTEHLVESAEYITNYAFWTLGSIFMDRLHYIRNRPEFHQVDEVGFTLSFMRGDHSASVEDLWVLLMRCSPSLDIWAFSNVSILLTVNAATRSSHFPEIVRQMMEMFRGDMEDLRRCFVILLLHCETLHLVDYKDILKFPNHPSDRDYIAVFHELEFLEEIHARDFGALKLAVMDLFDDKKEFIRRERCYRLPFLNRTICGGY